MGKHVKEQLDAEPMSPRHGPLLGTGLERFSNSSLDVEPRASSPVSTLGNMRAVDRRWEGRKKISRNDSEWSERTVTAADRQGR